MTKVRIFEFSKTSQFSSKDYVKEFQAQGFKSVKNHMAIVDEADLKKVHAVLEERLSPKKEKAPEKKEVVVEKPVSKPSESQAKTKPNHSKNTTQTSSKPASKRPDTEKKEQRSERPNTQEKRSNRPAGGRQDRPQGARSERPSQSSRTDRPASKGFAKATPKVEVPQGEDVKRKKPVKKVEHRSKAENSRFDDSKEASFNSRKKDKKKRKNEKTKTQLKKERKAEREAEAEAALQKLPKIIRISDSLTVEELAAQIHVEISEIIKTLLLIGIMATKNQVLEYDVIELLADEFNATIEEVVYEDELGLEQYIVSEEKQELALRAPIVTIMGHVDHGKTTLLDTIRNSQVTSGEAGGITQHIGAYQAKHQDKTITFIDTPGHEAFTTMRARGAKVTDITVLVVAADDSVMPQTVEAINHAKAAETPIIVAINKMDKPEANPDRVMTDLVNYDLMPEEWGGQTPFVKISAKSGEGIEDLLDYILLVTEVGEYKADPQIPGTGTVLEANLDKGRGPVATLLVQNGTLRVGDAIVVGNTWGSVRVMQDEFLKRYKEAGPSVPVEITGLKDVPNAGDTFVVFKDVKEAQRVGEERSERAIIAERSKSSGMSLEDLSKQMQEGDIKELNVIVKTDVRGTLEAMLSSLQKIDVEGARVKVVHGAVGSIKESDIILASASNAIVIGFNVRPDTLARKAAKEEEVEVRVYNIIYKVIEDIELAMKGLLDPVFEEQIIGNAEVRSIFKVSKIGTIAGAYVIDGKIQRDAGCRVVRDGIVIYEGKLASLRRVKDDVKEVATGFECGFTIENYNDLKEGDTVEFFVMVEVKNV